MIDKRATLTIVVILAIGAVLIAIAYSRGTRSAQDGLGHTITLPVAPDPPRN
jgi:hypothetical protein